MIKNMSYTQSKPYDILVTGATGVVGSFLVNQLVSSGYTVKSMSRKSGQDSTNLKCIKADALNYNELLGALDGVNVAFYLLHSMEGDRKNWKNFQQREKTQAQNFIKAATKAGVKRIIYLGGLVNSTDHLSNHMKSRTQVGEILSSGNIPVTTLRASIVIGSRSGSYLMLRYLVERLRVMICPRWIKSKTQPIALSNVVDYLIGCMEHPETSEHQYDIGGPDVLTYEQLMRHYSAHVGKNLWILEIPFLTPRLSSYWIDLVTPVKASLARPLVDSLIHDTVVKDNSIRRILPIPLKNTEEAIRSASILEDI